MDKDHDEKGSVTFKDVLLARNYLSELREMGKLSPKLQAAVDERGREHVESVASILGRLDERKAI
jgi:hypothetical protein